MKNFGLPIGLSPPALKPNMIIAMIKRPNNSHKLQGTKGTKIKQMAGPPRAIDSKIFRETVSVTSFFFPIQSETIPKPVSEKLSAM